MVGFAQLIVQEIGWKWKRACVACLCDLCGGCGGETRCYSRREADITGSCVVTTRDGAERRESHPRTGRDSRRGGGRLRRVRGARRGCGPRCSTHGLLATEQWPRRVPRSRVAIA